MENFEFYQNIRLKDFLNNKKIARELNNIYKKVPETFGCLEHINNIHNSCNGWCCQIQFPSLFYCEFLNIWNYISNNFDNDFILNIIEKSINNSIIMDNPAKKCIFFNDENKLCICHKYRGINCMFYGITPEEEFNDRLDKIKKMYENRCDIFIRNQCNLVKIKENKKISSKDINRWWKQLLSIERDLGIPENKINDGNGGSYRSPHDHVLLYLMPDNVLNLINEIKLQKDELEKKISAEYLINNIRKFYGKQKN